MADSMLETILADIPSSEGAKGAENGESDSNSSKAGAKGAEGAAGKKNAYGYHPEFQAAFPQKK